MGVVKGLDDLMTEQNEARAILPLLGTGSLSLRKLPGHCTNMPNPTTGVGVEPESNVGQAYPYRQLQGSDIRYVTLKPFDKNSGLVECTIWQKPLEEAQYTALSYAWGDPCVTAPIIVAGQHFEVTTNLAACLKHLAVRQTAKDPAEDDSGLNIWVDAICINQHDVVERNAQVLRMKDIFPLAERLVVWLGEEGPHTGLAVERINEVARLLEGIMKNEDGNGLHDAWKKLPKHIYSRTIDKHEMMVRSGIMDIYQREWWERIWILQEVGLSKGVVVHCGYYEMTLVSLESFGKFAGYTFIDRPEVFETAGDEGVQMIDLKELPLTVLNLRDDLEDNYQSRLHILLNSTKNQRATDPRDKIYGLLGLSSDFRSGGIYPRYEHPVQDVFCDVLKAHFEKYDSLDILDQCYFGHTAELGLPSWRPNWDVTDQDFVIQEVVPKYLAHGGEELKQAFNACGGLSLSSRPWSFGNDNTLHLTGACFDTIKSVTDVADFLRKDWTLESLLEAWLPTVPTPNEKYPFASETWLSAFRRTIVLDLRFLSTERDFSMVFPDDPDSKDKATFQDRIIEARMSFYSACMLKRLAYTSKGIMGLVRPETQVGDRIAVLAGSKVLHCLREVNVDVLSGETHYQLIGEAYFHGMMDGEAMNGLELDKVILV